MMHAGQAVQARIDQLAPEQAALDVIRLDGEVSLATFWRQATPAGGYWRCTVPARQLPGQSLYFDMPDAQWDDERDELVLPRQRGKTAIWQFLGDDVRSRVAFALQQQGIRTLMEVDDNYLVQGWNPARHQSSWAKTHREAVETGVGYSTEAHRLIVPEFDGIIVATDYLAEQYRNFNDNVYVCPNSIDPADWDDIPRHEDDVFRIGYYGSPSHLKDYPLVKKALKWAGRQPGVEIVIIGFNPPGFSGTVMPWVDSMADARRQLGQLDLGLAPLDSRLPWSRGKSDLKALEYAMAGVMPLMSYAEPFRPWFDKPEFMVEDGEWLDALQWAVQQRADIKHYADAAKQYVLENRTIKKNIHHWEEAVFGG